MNVSQAIKILEDGISCDVIKIGEFLELYVSFEKNDDQYIKVDVLYISIKIGGIIRNKQRFVKRRQRLIGF